MANPSLYEALLKDQSFAAFEFLGDGSFRLLGQPPHFCTDLLGNDLPLGDTIRLGDRFPFIEFFLVDAQTVWNAPSDARAESGLWVESTSSGRELALEATALRLLGRCLLVLHNPQDSYGREVQLQQAAHTASLVHERLQREIQKKEILLHCIVHDLSQPLTTIRGTLSLLTLQDLPSRLKQAVDAAQRQSVRQEEMITAILAAFSADLAVQQVLDHDPAKFPNLEECARATVEAFRDAFVEREARIELDPSLDATRSWRVRGDAAHLLRIYGNLVENALRHSPPNSVATVGVIDEDRYVKGFVDDQGPGLAAESTPQLFNLFAKGKGESGGKAGLGLYFCKITVERWGGTIGCAPRPTGGTRFWFRLPRL